MGRLVEGASQEAPFFFPTLRMFYFLSQATSKLIAAAAIPPIRALRPSILVSSTKTVRERESNLSASTLCWASERLKPSKTNARNSFHPFPGIRFLCDVIYDRLQTAIRNWFVKNSYRTQAY